jgi:SAM-dependent methyltransferase
VDDERLRTDLHWEDWGARDPYYGVLTDPQFRIGNLTSERRQAFFDSGGQHVEWLFSVLESMNRGPVRPVRALDFGCGVGRLVVPLARRSEHVTGVDVSQSMLAEARRNSDAAGLANVSFEVSDDELSALRGDFDLVHSVIVLQHVPQERGRKLFERLVSLVSPAGWGAIHVTFGLAGLRSSYGQPRFAVASSARRSNHGLLSKVTRGLRTLGDRPSVERTTVHERRDPEMQMFYYNFSELLYILSQQGITQVTMELTDHGGALGAMVVFRRPLA